MPKSKPAKLPKRECCASSSRCGRCPIRMLREGTLPAGYGVKKRKLVRLDVVVTSDVIAEKKAKKGKKSSKKGKGKDKKLALAA